MLRLKGYFCLPVLALAASALFSQDAPTAARQQSLLYPPSTSGSATGRPKPTPVETGDSLLLQGRYQAAIAAYAKSPSMTAEIWNKTGMANELMDNLDEAVRCYNESLRLNPNDPRVLNNLATLKEALKDYGTADRLYRKALKLDPNFGMAKAVLGESYWRKYAHTKEKQWIPLAQSNCDEAVKLANAGAAGHACLGLIDNGTGHYPEAAAEYQLALGLEPANEEAALGLASAYQHEDKIAEAEKAYQQAIQAHPNSRDCYNNFGAFYVGRTQYEKALEMYNHAIQIAPEWYATYSNVGVIYNELGQYEKAVDTLKKSITIRPSYGAYVNLGVAYFGLNKFSEATEAYQEAAKLDPQQYLIWGDLGDALFYSGKKDQSVTPYRKAIELASAELKVNPRDPDVLSSLASYYSMIGDRKNSVLYLGQALQSGHNDKDVLLDAASVYNHLGESSLAIEFLAKVVRAGYSREKIRSLHDFDNLAGLPAYQQLVKSK